MMDERYKNYHILIVDDEPLIRKSLYEILKIEGFRVQMASAMQEAKELVRKTLFDIVITDLKLADADGIDLLGFIKKNFPATEVIVITGYGTIESAVSAMKQHAFDYVTKPIHDEEIKLIIARIIEKKELLRENIELRAMVEMKKRSTFYGIVGQSEAMQQVYRLIESVASTNATIMISGESGTGKGLVARAIHQHDQNRRAKPFVEVSCGALSETLLESELFGHVKGAFTGAIRDKAGRFELADGATIFLDEIDTCSQELQVKLLRVLQDGGYERVGDTQTRKTDARVIVATNQDLEKLVEEGKFREDLYYRIHVIPIAIAPLRQRKDDINLLVEHFIRVSNEKNNKNVKGISDEVKKLFMEYRWPGNIRQLENVIEGSVIMAQTHCINKRDLPVTFNAAERKERNTVHQSLEDGLKEPAKELILTKLREMNGNRSLTAASLGINRTTLYNKMKKYGISFK
ncbi:MAG: sigma-54-dependent Fis family transcriptional regulator [Candidatus Omnitrophica bacterium]|nr:sigma-54-dependent Fis family transcriptional regulator [Candidatus Omnitrophota bacterium]MDE2009762.1 sigma-54-dependent Fis family transcriptional regulator [Candidatus Omnitrophota bacterium]MDE2213843.1 sigma-54-dependent Fis family transcriptional regulator [Candidatus Omnitrophota bacterium]MDE2232376.1 sigma-54-dependent Fis family transcriptional regulator [Candidatus Omnitrophota bacterium]